MTSFMRLLVVTRLMRYTIVGSEQIDEIVGNDQI
jgi:hypothetical protein